MAMKDLDFDFLELSSGCGLHGVLAELEGYRQPQRGPNSMCVLTMTEVL